MPLLRLNNKLNMKFMRLNDEQNLCFEQLDENKFISVKGHANTGKTVLVILIVDIESLTRKQATSFKKEIKEKLLQVNKVAGEWSLAIFKNFKMQQVKKISS